MSLCSLLAGGRGIPCVIRSGLCPQRVLCWEMRMTRGYARSLGPYCLEVKAFQHRLFVEWWFGCGRDSFSSFRPMSSGTTTLNNIIANLLYFGLVEDEGVVAARQ